LSAQDDEFVVVGDAEFQALLQTGDYTDNDENVLRRSLADRHFFVMRQREWDRYERIRREVDAEIDAMDREDERSGLFRGM
jgi:hypothetical protein